MAGADRTELDQAPEPTPGPSEAPDDLDGPADATVVDSATAPTTRRPSHRLRFAVAFLVSLIAAAALGTGVIYAYEQQHAGRVLPGVRVGEVDLSGLDREAAVAKLSDAYASFAEGRASGKTWKGAGPDGTGGRATGSPPGSSRR